MTHQPYFNVLRANNWFERRKIDKDFESRRYYVNLISAQSNLTDDIDTLEEGLLALLELAHREEKNRFGEPLISEARYHELSSTVVSRPDNVFPSEHLNRVRKELMDELKRFGL